MGTLKVVMRKVDFSFLGGYIKLSVISIAGKESQNNLTKMKHE